MVCVAAEYHFSIEIELGSASAEDGKFGVIPKGDMPVCTWMVR
jgi:hypothetical protein